MKSTLTLVQICVLALAVLVLGMTVRLFAADKAAAGDDSKWKDIAFKEGDLPKGGSIKVKLAPRTSHWRLHLTSAFTDGPTLGSQQQSLIKVSVWIEEHDGLKRVWKSLDKDGGFKGKAGDGTDRDFDNGGAWPDGARRQMLIVVSGQFVKYELEVQDQGEKPLTKAKEKAEKKDK